MMQETTTGMIEHAVEEAKARFASRSYPFLTLSGSHLYGFPSPDSDIDVRGAHVLPVRAFLSLSGKPQETIEEKTGDIELVTHDIGKFCRLLLKHNGYALEQLMSPLIIQTSPIHEELLSTVPQLLSQQYYRHYQGFAYGEWKLLVKRTPTVKRVLYIVRVTLTGIHLLRTGELECNIAHLLQDYDDLSWVNTLVEQKQAYGEHAILSGTLEGQRPRVDRLLQQLEDAYIHSILPEERDKSVNNTLEELSIRAR